jgi:hypothetical protein
MNRLLAVTETATRRADTKFINNLYDSFLTLQPTPSRPIGQGRVAREEARQQPSPPNPPPPPPPQLPIHLERLQNDDVGLRGDVASDVGLVSQMSVKSLKASGSVHVTEIHC